MLLNSFKARENLLDIFKNKDKSTFSPTYCVKFMQKHDVYISLVVYMECGQGGVKT